VLDSQVSLTDIILSHKSLPKWRHGQKEAVHIPGQVFRLPQPCTHGSKAFSLRPLNFSFPSRSLSKSPTTGWSVTVGRTPASCARHQRFRSAHLRLRRSRTERLQKADCQRGAVLPGGCDYLRVTSALGDQDWLLKLFCALDHIGFKSGRVAHAIVDSSELREALHYRADGPSASQNRHSPSP